MPGALITIDQLTGAGAGTPGVARNDLWQNKQVDLVDGAGGNSSWDWTLVDKPPGSAASLTGAGLSTASFTPDLVGTYRVQLTTNGGGPGNVQVKVARVRYNSSGVLTQRGWALPAKNEVEGESNYPGNDRAWAQVFEYMFADLRSAIDAVSGLGPAGGDLGANYPDPVVEGLTHVTSDLTFHQASTANISAAAFQNLQLNPGGGSNFVGVSGIKISGVTFDSSGSVPVLFIPDFYFKSGGGGPHTIRVQDAASGPGEDLVISPGAATALGQSNGDLSLLGLPGPTGTGVLPGGDGSSITITGGAGGSSGGAANGTGGAVTIKAGNGGTDLGVHSPGAGNDLSLDAGAGSPNGSVLIGDTDADEVVIGRAGKPVTIVGNLAATGAVVVWTVTTVKTTTYTAAFGELVQVNPGGGAFAVHLPSAAGQTGKMIAVKNKTNSTNAVTVTPNGGETIDGDPTYVINVAHESVWLVADGVNWMVLA